MRYCTFQSDEGSRYRVIRAFKNRFGAVNELGVFAMTGLGLKEVSNPSAIFLSGHSETAAGSVITVIREGTRPMLLELQALVDESHLANPRTGHDRPGSQSSGNAAGGSASPWWYQSW